MSRRQKSRVWPSSSNWRATSNMICFDFEGKIKKYNSPEEIIDHRRVLSKAVGILPETENKHFPDLFYVGYIYDDVKLTTLFQDFLANELQSQFERLSNQARFVKMIVNKELVGKGESRRRSRVRWGGYQWWSRGGDRWRIDRLWSPSGHAYRKSHEREGALCAHALICIWLRTNDAQIERFLQQAADKVKELSSSPIQIWNATASNGRLVFF